MRGHVGRALVLATAIALGCVPAIARPAEYLSAQEQDAVRDAQEVTLRARVFVKLAGRRLLAIEGMQQEKKDEERYGPLPTGSPAVLLDDYARVLDELMDKLDDLYDRQGKSKAMTKAMKDTVAALEIQLATLQGLGPKLAGEDAAHSRERAIETLGTVLDGIRPLTVEEKK